MFDEPSHYDLRSSLYVETLSTDSEMSRAIHQCSTMKKLMGSVYYPLSSLAIAYPYSEAIAML